MYKQGVRLLFLLSLWPFLISASQRILLSEDVSEDHVTQKRSLHVQPTEIEFNKISDRFTFLELRGTANRVLNGGGAEGGKIRKKKKFIGKLFRKIKSKAKKIFHAVKGGVKKVFHAVKGGVKKVFHFVKKKAKGTLKGLLGAAGLALGLALKPKKIIPPAEKCKPNGEGGKNCYPYEQYDMYTTLKRMRGCCKPCTEKFVRELSLLEVSSTVKKEATKNFHTWKEAHNRRSNSIATLLSFIEETQQAKTGSTLRKGYPSMGMEARAGMSLPGSDIHNLLPCCDVCVEEFFAPNDFDDLSSFLDIQNGKIKSDIPDDNFRFKADRGTTFLKGMRKSSITRSKSRNGGDARTISNPTLEPMTNPFTASSHFANSLKNAVPKTGHCCKICPADRYPSRGYNNFKPAPTTFLETLEGEEDDSCCPVCPTLFTLSSGGYEPFGGPFGEGTANMAQAMTEAIQTMCSCYPNCEAHIAENHVGCREQDIRASLTSFIQMER